MAKSDFLGVYERCRDSFGSRKKTGYFCVAKKGIRDFLGYAKKSSVFWGGRQTSEVVIFLSIKYEPLSPPPPLPVIKICEWAPGVSTLAVMIYDVDPDDTKTSSSVIDLSHIYVLALANHYLSENCTLLQMADWARREKDLEEAAAELHTRTQGKTLGDGGS